MKNLSILEVEFLRSKCFKNPKTKFYSPVLYYNTTDDATQKYRTKFYEQFSPCRSKWFK